MVEASKILTVSYGTFSCTLEGFDDPFSTMRGISEYFRDLAAGDRYFGAEPPTPDAEMLHRIAEREIQSRVTAHVDDNGITLRQLESTQATQPIAPTPIQGDPVTAAVAAVAAPVVAPTAAPIMETAMPMDGSAAAKLARIRAVVSRNTDQGFVEDQHANEMFATAPISAAFAQSEEAELVDEAPEVEAAQDIEPEIEEIAEPEIEEIAEVEVEDVAEFVSEDVTGDVEIEAEADVEIAADTSDEVQDDDGDALSRVMGSLSDDVAVEEAEAEVEASEEPDSDAIARVVKMRRADLHTQAEVEDDVDLDEVEEIEVKLDAVSEFFASNVEDENEEEVEFETQADEETEVSEEFTAEVVEDQVEEEVEVEAVSDDADEGELSDEDEADLMATLEQVQRENDAEDRADKEGRALLENQDVEADGNAVERILEVTNTELEETEGTRRRSAIAHLKAAVMATRADKKLAKERKAEEITEMNQYRDDLARVVRPNRPKMESKKSARRMAPLVLVSEQRIDEVEVDEVAARTNEVVIPRRVRAAQDEVAGHIETLGDNASFLEFAEKMGATELPDLLEAAAAFSSYVEGQPHFSRPQLMKAVMDSREVGEISREDGLRSFGQLLRRGKIQKIKRGQFTVSQSTRFNPDVRAAGE